MRPNAQPAQLGLQPSKAPICHLESHGVMESCHTTVHRNNLIEYIIYIIVIYSQFLYVMLDLDLPIRCHIIHIATSVTSGFGICWNLRLLSARPNTKGPWVDHDKTSSWWVIMWHDGDTMWQGLYFCLYELWPVSRMANVDGDVEMSSNPKGHNSTSAVCRLWSHRFIQSSFWLRHSYV